MKTISGVLSDLAIKLNEKLGGEPLNDSRTKSVTGCLQQIANVLSGNSGDSKTVIGALESIADAVEDMDVGGGDVKELIERTISGAYQIPEGVTVIGEHAFSGCINMTEIIIPEGIEEIRNGAFYACNTLKEIITPQSCISINPYGFSGKGTFAGTLALEKAIFPSVTSFHTDNDAPFGGAGTNSESLMICFPKLLEAENNLISGAKVTNCYMPAVTTVGNSFQGCSKLAEVYIGPNCTSIGTGAFGGTKSGIVINCGFAEGDVSGAPWAASNATINYNVPVPNVED